MSTTEHGNGGASGKPSQSHRGRSATRNRQARSYHDESASAHVKLGPRDDRRYFEQLMKAIFQAGLSWPTVESHWPGFGEVFHDFDPAQVAAMTEQDIDQAMQDPRIIRNHRKVAASVASAAAANEVIADYGSMDAYLRSFDSPDKEIADLQHRFAGLGGYSAWWFMQSVGLPVPPAH
jgi:DNA-3-methyladenine glycosylase I